jgi:CBS domain-containing protein
MRLRDLVGVHPHICGPETTLQEASVAMAEAGHGSLAVIEDRRVSGVITERDIVRAVAARADLSDPVRRWMGAEPDVFDADTDVFDAAEWLLESGYRHLPVVEGEELLGVVSLRNLLSAVLRAMDEEE